MGKKFWSVVGLVVSVVAVVGCGYAYSVVDHAALHDIANSGCRHWSGHCDSDLFMAGVFCLAGILVGIGLSMISVAGLTSRPHRY